MILEDPAEIELLRQALDWVLAHTHFYDEQAEFDANDAHLLRTSLLPRLQAPFDTRAGTLKDHWLLTSSLEVALAAGLPDQGRGLSLLDSLRHDQVPPFKL